LIPAGMTEVRCNVCNGRGIIPTPDGREWQLCPRCGGSGKIRVCVDTWKPGCERW